MSTFPALQPSARTWTPGEYPHAQFRGLNGTQRTVRQSNVMMRSSLRLAFQALTQAQMLSIVAHYLGQQGTFAAFGLPVEVWSGVATASDYSLANYLWRYAEPPTVEDLAADETTLYNLELKLESCPNEGAEATGATMTLRWSLSGGTPGAANGASLSVGWSLTPGYTVLTMPGLAGSVGWSLTPGWPLNDGALFGLNGSIVWAISGGSATGDNVPTADYWNDWSAQVYGWSDAVSVDWWGL